jgi:hypothetical protein
MDKHWTRRAVVGAALSAVTVPTVMGVAVAQEKTAPAAAVAARGKLTDATLGTLLKAMGVDATPTEQRYDFPYKATIEDAEWDLSMSAVLSQDGASIWIMAWLDELPKSAADVPRTALLRLLADNDKLGKGKFFAYIPANRRFVLQRVIPNENITAATFRAALDDLGQSVAGTHAHWYVPNWTSPAGEDPATAARTGAPVKGSSPQAGASAGTTRPATTANGGQTVPGQTVRPAQSAVNDSKFNPSTKR